MSLRKIRYALFNWIVKYFVSIISRLPLSINMQLGTIQGLILYWINSSVSKTAYTNLKICFPDKDDEWHQNILKKSLIENSKTIFESYWLWRHPWKMPSLVGKVENDMIVTYASNESTIFITPHFGSWECAGLYAASRINLAILYTQPKLQFLHQFSIHGRSSTGAQLLEATPSSLRELLRHIKKGGSVGILPDQVPAGNSGVYVPFFNRLAFTSTIACKLAKKHHCTIVVGYSLRNEKHKLRYDMYCRKAPEEVYSKDERVAASALNQLIEECILTAPEQYLWAYKRFKNPAPSDNYPY